MPRHLIAAVVMSAACFGGPATAQQKSAADGIAEYRAMLADGNPAELFEARGEDVWKKPRGPKNASLEQCDLGKGPGVVKGAFVELPRWFADTGKVQDLESRLLTCMERLQGFNAAEIARTPFGKGEQLTMEGLTAWISAERAGSGSTCHRATPTSARPTNSASARSSTAAGPTISRAPRATGRPTSASACKTSPS